VTKALLIIELIIEEKYLLGSCTLVRLSDAMNLSSPEDNKLYWSLDSIHIMLIDSLSLRDYPLLWKHNSTFFTGLPDGLSPRIQAGF